MKKEESFEDLVRKIDALGLWPAIQHCRWTVKPKGTAFPYFCETCLGDGKPVKVRLLMLEGWTSFLDYVQFVIDRANSFYTSPIELPHFELIVMESGEFRLCRYDTGLSPRDADDQQKAFVKRILWEVYGVMLRVESDPSLAMRYAAERAVFARVETSDDHWEDIPLPVPPRPKTVDRVTVPKDEIRKAKDLPFLKEKTLHVNFALLMCVVTKEQRARNVYAFDAYDPAKGQRVFDWRVSIPPGGTLKGLWESMPAQFVRSLNQLGYTPGEIKVMDPRVFRLLRSLCVELPFKLSLHDELEMG